METWNEIKESQINSASVNLVNLVNLKYNKNSRFEIYYVSVNLVNINESENLGILPRYLYLW